MAQTKQQLYAFLVRLERAKEIAHLSEHIHAILRHSGFSFHEASCYYGTKFLRTTIGTWYLCATHQQRIAMWDNSIRHCQQLIEEAKE